jgi:hypothetical protein
MAETAPTPVVAPAPKVAVAAKAQTPAENMSAQDESNVLAHQITGIMMHSDLAVLFDVLEQRKLSQMHCEQAVDELATHNKLRIALAGKMGRDINPEKTKRIDVLGHAENALGQGMLVSAVIDHALTDWLEWEKETDGLYKSMANKHSDMRCWKKMLKSVKNEIEFIEWLMKKRGLI